VPRGPTPRLPGARGLSNDTKRSGTPLAYRPRRRQRERERERERGRWTFPFRNPLSRRTRVIPSPRGGNQRNDFSRRVFSSREILFKAALQGGFQSRRAALAKGGEGGGRRGGAGERAEVSASNKNLGQIGGIVQFYLLQCPPRNALKVFPLLVKAPRITPLSHLA